MVTISLGSVIWHHRSWSSLAGIISCMRPTNERRRYIVTSSLIGWAHTQNDPCQVMACWLLAYLVPSHYLNQCWHIVNWILRKKLQWNAYQNSSSFIQEDAFKNIAKGRPFCAASMCKQTDGVPYNSWFSLTHWGLDRMAAISQKILSNFV